MWYQKIRHRVCPGGSRVGRTGGGNVGSIIGGREPVGGATVGWTIGGCEVGGATVGRTGMLFSEEGRTTGPPAMTGVSRRARSPWCCGVEDSAYA